MASPTPVWKVLSHFLHITWHNQQLPPPPSPSSVSSAHSLSLPDTTAMPSSLFSTHHQVTSTMSTFSSVFPESETGRGSSELLGCRQASVCDGLHPINSLPTERCEDTFKVPDTPTQHTVTLFLMVNQNCNCPPSACCRPLAQEKTQTPKPSTVSTEGSSLAYTMQRCSHAQGTAALLRDAYRAVCGQSSEPGQEENPRDDSWSQGDSMAPEKL